MLYDNTVRKLREMRLNVMADLFKEQVSDPKYQSMSFEDRFSLIVDRQWDTRKSNRLKNLIKEASLSNTSAAIEGIEYSEKRKIDRHIIEKLATCDYIRNNKSVIILGAAGSGKTYIACALGIEACRNFIKVRYIRLPELLTELAIARGGGTLYKTIEQYQKYPLLIIDEWMLNEMTEMEARDMLEILDYREKVNSTIFCSQVEISSWRGQIKNKLAADARPQQILCKTE